MPMFKISLHYLKSMCDEFKRVLLVMGFVFFKNLKSIKIKDSLIKMCWC